MSSHTPAALPAERFCVGLVGVFTSDDGAFTARQFAAPIVAPHVPSEFLMHLEQLQKQVPGAFLFYMTDVVAPNIDTALQGVTERWKSAMFQTPPLNRLAI